MALAAGVGGVSAAGACCHRRASQAQHIARVASNRNRTRSRVSRIPKLRVDAAAPAPPTEPGVAPWSAPEACFEVSDGDCEAQDLHVEGVIPSWVCGDFIRNGPGGWDGGNRPMRHMFDGYALLIKVSFRDGKATSEQRYIRSTAYNYYAKHGRMLYDEFGTGKEADTLGSRVKKMWMTGLGLAGLQDPPVTDNAVVNVISEGDGTLVAMTESVPGTYLLDQDTLETLHRYKYSGSDGTADPIAQTDLTTAHPFVDPSTNEVINVESTIGYPTPSRFVWSRKLGSSQRHLLASFSGRDASTSAADFAMGKKDSVSFSPPAYFHSFSTSKKHVMVHELPTFFDLEALIFGAHEKSEYVSFTHSPDLGTVLHLIDRDPSNAQQKPQVFHAPSFFCFHTVNSFDSDDGEKFITDLVTFKDPQVVRDLLLKNLTSDPQLLTHETLSTACLTRLTLHKQDGVCETEVLSDFSAIGDFLELPTINPDLTMDPNYKYVYGICAAHRPSRLANGLAKVNVESGDVEGVWCEPGHIPTELRFIPRPGATAQDDGVLVSLVTAPDGARSFCLVLDGKTFDVLAKAYFREGHRLPYGFHGTFVPGRA